MESLKILDYIYSLSYFLDISVSFINLIHLIIALTDIFGSNCSVSYLYNISNYLRTITIAGPVLSNRLKALFLLDDLVEKIMLRRRKGDNHKVDFLRYLQPIIPTSWENGRIRPKVTRPTI